MVELAKKKYSNRFDIQAGELWFRGIALRQPMGFLPIRTDDAFCVGMITANPWTPTEYHAIVSLICAEDGKIYDALTLLRECLAWARRRKCVDWRINSETAFDLRPMARRLGAVEDTGTYKVTLDE